MEKFQIKEENSSIGNINNINTVSSEHFPSTKLNHSEVPSNKEE